MIPRDHRLHRLGRISRDTWRWLLALLLLLVSGQSLGVQRSEERPRHTVLRRAPEFTSTWKYCLGRSPVTETGQWLWAQPDFSDESWPSSRPGKTPMASSQRELWARVPLTGEPLSNPLLLLRVVGYNPELFLDGCPYPAQELPHHMLEEQHSHERRFLVHLPVDYAGKILSIHLHSNGPRIGVLDPLYLGEPASVMMAMIADAASALALAVIIGFLGLATGILYLVNRNDTNIARFSLVCLVFSTFLFSGTGVLGVITNTAFPSSVVFTVSGALSVNVGSAFVQEVLARERWRFLRWLRAAILLGVVGEICTILYDIRLMGFLMRPVLMMMMSTAAACIFISIQAAREGHVDGKIICAGTALCALFSIPNLLAFAGAGSGSRQYQFALLQLGFALFFLSMGMVLIRRFMEIHNKLGLMSEMLGEQVRVLERRNTDIQHLNDELRRQIEQRSDRMIEILTRSRWEQVPGTSKELASGELLSDHYRVVRPLGRGAMGAVYEVERISDGTHLAAKLMTAKADRGSLIRFVREARILAQLKHPNLVGIADIDISADGDLFLAMELIQGCTLKDAKERYGEPSFSWTVLRHICLGLQAIHAAGITHRDLKPANVLITETPTGTVAKIADFGISTLGSSSSTLPANLRLPTCDVVPSSPSFEQQPASPAQPDDEGMDATSDLPVALAQGKEGGGDVDGSTQDLPSTAAADGLWDELATADVPIDDAHSEKKSSPLERVASIDPDQALHAKQLAEIREAFMASGQLTKTGVLLGTPMYMAPELASGSRKAPPSSDLFSLGVIAFELLSGKLPFSEPPVVSVWENRPLEFERLRDLRPDLPPTIVEMMERCLSIEPSKRPSLEAILAQIPTATSDVPLPRKTS